MPNFTPLSPREGGVEDGVESMLDMLEVRLSSQTEDEAASPLVDCHYDTSGSEALFLVAATLQVRKMGSEVRIPLSSYARRLRQEVINSVGKLIRTAGRTILKVTEATARRLGLKELFERVASPPRFRWT